jgi:hypothetical protein
MHTPAFRRYTESLRFGELLAGAHHIAFGDRDCGAPAVANSREDQEIAERLRYTEVTHE